MPFVSQVRICREKASGKIFAIKKLNKAEMLKRGQVEHVKAERNVLAEVHNPYVVKLFYSFQVSLQLGSRSFCFLQRRWQSAMQHVLQLPRKYPKAVQLPP